MDRGTLGAKRSLLTDGGGGPMGLAVAGANRHDLKLTRETSERIAIARSAPTADAPQGMCLDSGAMHPHILGDGLALPSPVSHQDRLTPVAAAVLSRFAALCQMRLFRPCQPDPTHRFHPLSCKAVREGSSKKMQSHPLHV